MSGSEVILGHVGTETSIGQLRKDVKPGLLDCRFVITVPNREREAEEVSGQLRLHETPRKWGVGRKWE